MLGMSSQQTGGVIGDVHPLVEIERDGVGLLKASHDRTEGG
jgi:hypothetical protein